MVGTRSNWKNLVPILEAFVSGAKIQKFNSSNGIWEDTEEMYGLLSEVKYRIKPKNITRGTWTINFIYRKPLVTGQGTLNIIGNSDDKPKWPVDSSIKYVEESEKFTPFENAESNTN